MSTVQKSTVFDPKKLFMHIKVTFFVTKVIESDFWLSVIVLSILN